MGLRRGRCCKAFRRTERGHEPVRAVPPRARRETSDDSLDGLHPVVYIWSTGRSRPAGGSIQHAMRSHQGKTIVAETALPMIPAATFDARSFGANGNGSTDNTSAFRRAIDACSAAGGGHVIVPSGTYVTGAIRLKNNVDLHLNSGAVLKFSGDSSKFPTVLTRYEGIECVNRSPMIYALGQHDISVTSSGTLDAANTSSWNKGNDRSF